jgi:nitrogen-specific signal transduction histidine kinase
MSDDSRAATAAATRASFVHEVRNSLGAIRTAAELLQQRYQPQGRELRLFEVIISEIDRLNDLAGAKKP